MKSFVLFILWFCSFNLLAQNNLAIVELFTSQGCSSCPAADRNLTEVLAQASKEGNQVLGLSFHVDYWNYIGWKDPYSSKAFTERQRAYGEQMNLRSIYTPQMIVNGKTEFVGSNKSELKDALSSAYKQKPSYHILINQMKVEGDKLTFQYSVDKLPANEVINFAIVEKSVENFVSRGENSGRKLHHDNVVRSFSTKNLQHQDQITVVLPDASLKNLSLILYIQDKEWQVTGVMAQQLQ